MSRRYRRPTIEPLEPRLLFSASADMVLLDDADSDVIHLPEVAANTDLSQIYSGYQEQSDLPPAGENEIFQDNLAADDAGTRQFAQEVVFIDSDVEDYQSLIDDILTHKNNDDIKIVLLNSDTNGVTQITDTLANYSGVAAVHLISHGSAGNLQLGNAELNQATIGRYQDAIASWQGALTDTADIMVYGCDLAANDAGISLLEQLGSLTKADIAASNDRTGHQNYGGDWDLEVHRGEVDSAIAVSSLTQERWDGVLADTHHIHVDSGYPSLPLSSTNHVGQSFLYDSGNPIYTVNEISIELARYQAAEPQNITVELRDSWNGAILGSDTISSASLSEIDFEWKTFSFTDVTLNDNQTYVIQLSTDGNDDGILVRYNDSNRHNNSELIQNGTANPEWDLAFKVSEDDGLNSVPSAANPIPDQVIDEDVPYTYIVPANTFADADTNDIITYRAQLAGGGSLGWLQFNDATQTFHGTPRNDHLGTFTVELIATDNHGASTSTFFDLTVENINDDPFVRFPISDQAATENNAFSYTVPADAFGDEDADASLTFNAQLSGGDPLPAWLTFDASTRTFNGTPGTSDIGTHSIEVIASDAIGTPVVDTFDLIVVAAPVSGDIVHETTPPATENQGLWDGNDAWQSFTVSGSGNFFIDYVSIQLRLNPTADPAEQTITVSLLDDENGTVFASDTMSSTELGTTLEWKSFNLVTSGLTHGQQYFIKVSATGSDINPLVNVGIHNSNVYPDGNYLNNNFEPDNNRDLAFEISGSNDAPVVSNAIPDQTATQKSLFSYTIPGDIFTDPDDDNLSYSATQANGSGLPAWLNFDEATRTFSGEPGQSDTITWSITVTVTDGNGGTATDTFDINVIDVNDNPHLENAIPDTTTPDNVAFNYTFPENTFGDVDLDELSYTATLSDGNALPDWLEFDSATRTFSGTPTTSDVGIISIMVTANDGQGGMPVSDEFNLSVIDTNDDPVLVNAIANQTATEDTAFSFTIPANTFTDADVDDTLDYTATLAGGGALPTWLSFSPGTRTFSGTPTNDDVGTLSIEVIADDSNGGTPATSTFDITVNNTNDVPVVTDDAVSTGENTIFNGTVPPATDIDDAVASYALASDVTEGTLTFNNDGSYTFDPGTDFDDLAMGDSRDASFTYTATDSSGGVSSPATITITVNGTNDAPVATGAAVSTDENTILNGSVPVATDIDGTIEADGYTLVSDVSEGSLTFNPDGSYAFDPGADFDDLAAGVSRDVSFTYTATDDSGGVSSPATITITVNGANDVPVVTDATVSTSENIILNASVPTATDIDDAIASYALASDVTEGSITFNNDGSYTFNPGTDFDDLAAGDSRDVSFTYTATDNSGGVSDPATITITVNGANDDPVLVNAIPNQTATEDSTFTFQVPANTFADVDAGDSLTYTATLTGGGALPTWLAFDATTATFSGTPTNDDVGTISVTVSAGDSSGGTPATSTFDITVANTNDDPTLANAIADQVATEDVAFSFTVPASTFVDPDAGDHLVYAATLSGGVALPSWLAFDTATATFSGVPTNDDVGTLSIEVTANDSNGGTPATGTFDITVANVNDAPVLVNAIADQSATEDAAFTFQVPSNTFEDVDLGDTLTYTATLTGGGALPTWLTFDSAIGTFSGTPSSADVGVITIAVVVQDNGGLTATTSFSLTVVAETNNLPTTTGLPDIVNIEDGAADVIDLFASFDDVEDGSSQLTYAVVDNTNTTLISNISLEQTSGTLRLDYAANQFGISDISIQATDRDGASVVTTFRVTITSVNDVPFDTGNGPTELYLDSATPVQNLNTNGAFFDIEDGTQMTYTVSANSQPDIADIVAVDSETGSFVVTRNTLGTAGTTDITVRATDSEGAWVERAIRIHVQAGDESVAPEPAPEIPVDPNPAPNPDPTPVPTPDPSPDTDTAPVVDSKPEPDSGSGSPIPLPDDSTSPTDEQTSPPPQDIPPTPDPTIDNLGPAPDFLPVEDEGFGYGYHDEYQPPDTQHDRPPTPSGQSEFEKQLRAEAGQSNSMISLTSMPGGYLSEQEISDFNTAIDQARQNMADVLEEDQRRQDAISAVTISLTTGLVIWSLRASSLLLTLFSMLPLWKGIDPLPVLANVKERKKALEQQRKDKSKEDVSAREVGYLFDHAGNTNEKDRAQ